MWIRVGTGDRSERIRTYNFPQGRVTDHRIGLTLYKILQIMDGEGLTSYGKTGTVTITAISEDGNFRDSCTVMVTDILYGDVNRDQKITTLSIRLRKVTRTTSPVENEMPG